MRRRLLFNYFRSLGATEVDFVDYSDPYEEIAARMAQSDLIYLTGGQLSTIVNRLKSAGVDSLLRSFRGVVVGRSAGALALAKKCVVTNRYSCSVKLVDGLGFVNFSVKAHYQPEDDAVLEKLSESEKIYAIPERSALIYKQGTLSFMGELCVFEKGEKKRLNESP